MSYTGREQTHTEEMPPPFSRASEALLDDSSAIDSSPPTTASSQLELTMPLHTTSSESSPSNAAADMDSTTRSFNDGMTSNAITSPLRFQLPISPQANSFPAPRANDGRLLLLDLDSPKRRLKNKFARLYSSYPLETRARLEYEESRGYPLWNSSPLQTLTSRGSRGQYQIYVKRFDHQVMESNKDAKDVKKNCPETEAAATGKADARSTWSKHVWKPIDEKVRNSHWKAKMKKGTTISTLAMESGKVKRTRHQWTVGPQQMPKNENGV